MIIIKKKDQPFLKSLFSICRKSPLSTMRQIKVTPTNNQVVFEATDLSVWIRYSRDMYPEEHNYNCRQFFLPYENMAEKINQAELAISFGKDNPDKQFVFINGMISRVIEDEWCASEFPATDILGRREKFGRAEVPMNELIEISGFSSEDETRQAIFRRWGISEGHLFCTDGRILAALKLDDSDGCFTVFQYEPLIGASVAKRFNGTTASLSVYGTTDKKGNKNNEVDLIELQNGSDYVRIAHGMENPNPPKYKEVIPTFDEEHQPKFTVLTDNQKMAIAELVAQKAKTATLNDTSIDSFAHDNKIHLETEVKTQCPGVTFNTAFLLQCLNYCKTLEFKMQDKVSPAMFENETAQRMSLLMPMRIS